MFGEFCGAMLKALPRWSLRPLGQWKTDCGIRCLTQKILLTDLPHPRICQLNEIIHRQLNI